VASAAMRFSGMGTRLHNSPSVAGETCLLQFTIARQSVAFPVRALNIVHHSLLEKEARLLLTLIAWAVGDKIGTVLLSRDEYLSTLSH